MHVLKLVCLGWSNPDPCWKRQRVLGLRDENHRLCRIQLGMGYLGSLSGCRRYSVIDVEISSHLFAKL